MIYRHRLWAVLLLLIAAGCDEDPTRAPSDGSTAKDAPQIDAGPRSDGSTAADGAPDSRAPDLGPDCPDGFGGPPATKDPPVSGTWQLTFQDDFLGSTVDGSKWKVGQHWAGFNGLASNDPNNVSLGCGYLTFTAEKRKNTFVGKDYDYASAELTSFKRFRQKYGYFEARIKYDGTRGLWPAFWLMPDRGKYGNVDENRVSFLKFDLSGDSRSSVTSAKLELHVEAAETGGQNVALLPVADDSWSEASITGASRPTPDPLWIALAYDPQWTPGGTASFDVTDYINQELAGDRVASFALVDGFCRAREISFTSREGANAAHRPRLVLSGSPSTVVVTEDAAVGEGSAASQKLGTQAQLAVNESWGDTASTYDGGMEMDIMESLGQWGPHMTQHALHWDGYGSDHQSEGSGHVQLTSTADGFHTYGLSWQPGSVTFYVDGTKTWSWTNSRVASVELYMLLSLQVGGWKDSYGDNGVPDDASLPGHMVIDYVRVWSGSP